MLNEDKLQNIKVSVDKRLEDIIPKLLQSKYQALKDDIEINGLKKPIDLMIVGEDDNDYQAVIVDGHHRFRACSELKKTLMYSQGNYTILDMSSIEEALEYSFEINFMRRQLDEYHAAKWALDVYPNKTQKELASKVAVTQGTVAKVAAILKYSIESSDKTEEEKNQIEQLIESVESNNKGIDTVYTQLKVAEDVSNAIDVIEDKEISQAMQEQYETEKYKDKTAVKDLAEDVRLAVAEKSGKIFEVTKYDKETFPVMEKLVKLQGKYGKVNTVTFAGNQESIDNALSNVRTFLMNNINLAGADILEGVRQVLTEALEEKRERDIAVIMQKIKELVPEDNTRYFFAVMGLPRNLKGVA